MTRLTSSLALVCLLTLSACGEAEDEGSLDTDEGPTPAFTESDPPAPSAAEEEVTAAEAVDRMLTEMTVIADRLERVSDKETAEAAVLAIQRAAFTMGETAKHIDRLSNIDVITAVAANTGSVTELQARIARAMDSIAARNPELSQELQRALAAVPTLD